jgi:sn-glycerol 3-phosphate transport system permease protein
LVLKVYLDGVVNADIGLSSAQSVVLMAGVILLSALQFRFLGRRAIT